MFGTQNHGSTETLPREIFPTGSFCDVIVFLQLRTNSRFVTVTNILVRQFPVI